MPSDDGQQMMAISDFARLTARRLIVVGAAVTFMLLMDAVYREQFSRLFPGVDFPTATASTGLLPTLVFLACLPSLVLPLDVTRPSQMLVWLGYLMIVPPAAVVSAHSAIAQNGSILMVIAFSGSFVLLALTSRAPLLRLPRLAIPPLLFWGALIVVSALSYAILYETFGKSLRLTSWQGIYAQRLLWMQSDGGLLVGYAQSWQGAVINPFLMAYGIYRRDWRVFATGAILESAMFLIAAQRSLLLAPVLLGIVYLLFRNGGRGFGVRITIGTAALWVLPVLADFGSSLWSRAVAEILYYRSFINNGLLSAYYIEFFSAHPKVHFSAVKGLDRVFASPYTISYKEALSWHYLGYASDPNAHFLADGFAQAGYGGTLIVTIILALALWLLDSVVRSRRIPLLLTCLAAGMQVNSVANGQIPNLLLGGGFMALVLLLYVAPAGGEAETEPLPACAVISLAPPEPTS